MAYAHHPASHRHERRRRKAKLLRTQQQGHHHIVTGHQLAVGFQRHRLAQPIAAEHLMCLRQADLPWKARMMHAAHRSRARTAFSAGNQDPAGAGLRHAAGNGSHPCGGNQLDSDLRFLVGALQVINQLCQVLDGIDIVMRRRRNQGDSRGRAPGSGHVLRDLPSGQMTALAGLGPLCHLDLDFLRGKKVFPRNPEPAGSHLLDGGIQLCSEALRQFAALTAVGPSAQMIHGCRQAFMRFPGDRAVAHGPGPEPFHELLRRFHLLQRNRTAGIEAEGQHGADRPGAFLLHPSGIPFKGGAISLPDRLLQQMDRFRGIEVFLRPLASSVAVSAFARKPAGQRRRKSRLVMIAAVRLDPVQIGPRQGTWRIGEILIHQFFIQPDRFKKLGALISLQDGYTHLGRDLQHPGSQRPVKIPDGFLRRNTNRAAAAHRCHAGMGQVRVHRPGAIGHQHRQVMHVPGFRALQNHRNRRALPDPDQMLLQRGNRQQ